MVFIGGLQFVKPIGKGAVDRGLQSLLPVAQGGLTLNWQDIS